MVEDAYSQLRCPSKLDQGTPGEACINNQLSSFYVVDSSCLADGDIHLPQEIKLDGKKALDSDIPVSCCWLTSAIWLHAAIKPAQLVWNSGIACNAAAALLQSLSTLTVKLTDGHVPVFEIVAIRSVSCFVITVLWVSFMGKGVTKIFGLRTNLPFLLLRGIAGAGSMSFFYFGVLQLTMADAVTIFFTHPAGVIVLAFFWLGEAISWLGILGIISSLLGVFITSQPPFLTGGTHWSLSHVLGVMNCFISAIFATVAYVTIRHIGSAESPLCLGMWFHTMGIATSIIPLLVGVPDKPQMLRPLDFRCMAVLVMTSFSSQAFIARSFQVEKAAKSASAGYLQVVFGYLFGLFIFHDKFSVLGLLGSAIICLGVVAVSWPSKKVDRYHIVPNRMPDIEVGETMENRPMEPDISRKDLDLPLSDKELPKAVS